MTEEEKNTPSSPSSSWGPLKPLLAAEGVRAEEAEEHTWERQAERAYYERNPVKTRIMFYSLCAIMTVLIVWSAFAKVDQVTRGEGKVVPSQQVQILQSYDGGVITEINVREGDIVEVDQVLVKLDPTRFQATLFESQAEILALEAKSLRLLALANGTEFIPSQTLADEAPEIVAQERALFNSSQQELRVSKLIAQEQIVQREEELKEAKAAFEKAAKAFSLASRELAVTKPLVNSGAVSEVELLRLERDINNMVGERDQAEAQISRLDAAIDEAEQKIIEVELRFKNSIREDLSLTMARLNVLQESSMGLSDKVKQTNLRSPVRGTIKRIYYNTIGGVVLPGKEVIEIIPLDDSLLLEARIKPQDIAFLHPGQKANVKFTAYDFVIYGGLDAVVEHIGADTVTDDKGNPFYIVRVRTNESSLGEGKPIIPGMVASVDILTGKKTVLAYLFKPVLRAKQYALTER